MKKNIIIIGYDPEIIEMILSLENYSIDGYVDINKTNDDVFNLNFLGTDEYFSNKYSYQSSHKLVITIDDTAKRESLFNFYNKHSFEFATVISKKSNISKYCNIGKGCIVQDLTNISFNVNLGNNVKINTGANVMHDVTVGNHSTLAPNSVILGYVKIGDCCFVGANSTLLPNTIINANSILGAGCVVTKNLEKGVYAGVPARRIK
jgi:sugar O-acyltransferase (sialic acid O-acetyltransferase NeuD family)